MNRKPLQTYRLSTFAAALTVAVPNCCYQNAWEVVSELPQWHASYVEGWLVLEWEDDVLLVEHGWVCLPDTRIVDPSIIFLVEPAHPLAYFPGVIYSRQETLVFRGEICPRVRVTHGEDGLHHAGYKAAYDQARHLAQSLVASSHQKKRLIVQRALVAHR